MLKIAFSGIPGSGRSSLIHEVKKILSLKYNVDSLEEIEIKNPFDDAIKSSFISQFFNISTQINNENIKSIKKIDYFLCDRSVLDHWIYWKKYLLDKDLNNSLEDKNKIIEGLCRLWLKTYALIFNIRIDLSEIEKREPNKEFRKTNIDYIKSVEDLFMQTIKEDNLAVIEIWNNNSIDETAHKIIGHLSDIKVNT